jgi:hypothetical protein
MTGPADMAPAVGNMTPFRNLHMSLEPKDSGLAVLLDRADGVSYQPVPNFAGTLMPLWFLDLLDPTPQDAKRKPAGKDEDAEDEDEDEDAVDDDEEEEDDDLEEDEELDEDEDEDDEDEDDEDEDDEDEFDNPDDDDDYDDDDDEEFDEDE